LIGIGLTDDNLDKMLRNKKPAFVTSEDLQIPNPGFSIAIVAGMTVDGIKNQIHTAFQAHFGELPYTVHIPCVNVRDKLFVFPLLDERGRGHYILGFEQKQFESIRRGEFPTFECDSPKTTSPSHWKLSCFGEFPKPSWKKIFKSRTKSEMKELPNLELIEKICDRLIGISYDDLTTAERQIVDLLIAANYLKLNELKDVRHK